MTSDRYMSWTLCGDSKLTQQMPLPLTPITTSFGMQAISMISIKSRKDLRKRHSSLNKKKSVMMMNMPMQEQFSTDPEPEVIKDTYQVTSRFGGTIPQHDYLKKHFKSRNPVFNIPRRNEPVATDTIFSDTPAINDGSTMAQFFVGRDTLVCNAYGIKS